MNDNHAPGVLGDYFVGTLISGTHQPEDLAPVFLNTIASADLGRAIRLGERFERLWADGAGREDVLADMFDALNDIAPEGTHFGAHPGDGADFGFWRDDE